MIVRKYAASSRSDVDALPPVALSISHLTGSISKPTRGIFASISRAASAKPIRPSPTIPTGVSAVMWRSARARLFGVAAGGLGIRRPPRDFAADDGPRFGRAHRGDAHAEARKPFPHGR